MRTSIPTAILFFGSLALAAPLPKQRAVTGLEYFPVGVGYEWVYELKRSNGTAGTWTTKIVKVENVEGGLLVSEERIVDGNHSLGIVRLRFDAEGYHDLDSSGEFKTAVRLLPAKWSIGDEWEVSTQVSEMTRDYKFRIVGEETVEVPFGEYKAIKVSHTYGDAKDRNGMSYYYSKGIGIVRMTLHDGGDFKLKSFTRGDTKK